VELCADGSYDVACGTDIVIGVPVNDNEAGTYDTLTATVCSDANDVVDPSISCTNPDRVSSADGCNRGPAVCVWSCAGSCGELCVDGFYTGTCTDGALVSSDGAFAINDEFVVTSVGIVPIGPLSVGAGANVPFDCTASFADSCTYGCNLTAAWAVVGCPASTILDGDYIADPVGGCTDVVTAQEGAILSNGTTVVVTGVLWLDVLPDGPHAINDGGNIALTANDSVDGDVTADPNTTWVDLNGNCNVVDGLVTAPEGCGDYVCDIQATYDPGGAPSSDNEIVNVTNDETAISYQADMACNPVTDGSAIDCSGTNDYAADGCVLGPSACVPTCTLGCAVDPITDEGCIDASYDAACGSDSVAGVLVTDDEAGTFDTLTATVCSDANDVVDPSVSCTNPDRVSSADGCNRGPAVCVWSCAGDCGELCANGAYTGTCTDGVLVSSDGAIAINLLPGRHGL
jgi:hypothetical protein